MGIPIQIGSDIGDGDVINRISVLCKHFRWSSHAGLVIFYWYSFIKSKDQPSSIYLHLLLAASIGHTVVVASSLLMALSQTMFLRENGPGICSSRQTPLGGLVSVFGLFDSLAHLELAISYCWLSYLVFPMRDCLRENSASEIEQLTGVGCSACRVIGIVLIIALCWAGLVLISASVCLGCSMAGGNDVLANLIRGPLGTVFVPTTLRRRLIEQTIMRERRARRTQRGKPSCDVCLLHHGHLIKVLSPRVCPHSFHAECASAVRKTRGIELENFCPICDNKQKPQHSPDRVFKSLTPIGVSDPSLPSTQNLPILPTIHEALSQPQTPNPPQMIEMVPISPETPFPPLPYEHIAPSRASDERRGIPGAVPGFQFLNQGFQQTSIFSPATEPHAS